MSISGAGADYEELISALDGMTVHGGTRSPAPHKPLMVMWAIQRRIGTRRSRLFPYSEAHEPVGELLREAGRKPRPWYPFVRLGSESFWELQGCPPLNSAGDIRSKRDLADPAFRGGFLARYDTVLLDPAAAASVTSYVHERWINPNGS